MPYLSASAVVMQYEEALYQVLSNWKKSININNASITTAIKQLQSHVWNDWKVSSRLCEVCKRPYARGRTGVLAPE